MSRDVLTLKEVFVFIKMRFVSRPLLLSLFTVVLSSLADGQTGCLNSDRELKLTFTGDIMCDLPQIPLVLDGHRSFDEMFEDVLPLFQNADYVIGNLETPLAGEAARYTYKRFNFNSPDSFAEALRLCGFDFLTTANNHCLDRGEAGLDATVKTLDRLGIRHDGTYFTIEDSERINIVCLKGVKIAILSFCYGTNASNGIKLKKREWKIALTKRPWWCTDVKSKQHNRSSERKMIPERIRNWIRTCLPMRMIKAVRTHGDVLHKCRQYDVRIDHVVPSAITNIADLAVLDKCLKKVRRAKQIADLVVVCPHLGGQYNPAPGDYQKFVTSKFIEAGADLLVENHSHNPLQGRWAETGCFVAFSLGNFVRTPYLSGWVNGTMSEYSILLNVHVDVRTKRLNRITYSVLKSVIEKDGFAKVVPVSELYTRAVNDEERQRLRVENEAVVNRFVGGTLDVPILDEYTYPGPL